MAEDQSLQSAHSLPAEEGKDLGSSSNKSDNTGLITSQSGDPSAARNTSHNFPTSVEALLADDAASAHAGSGTQTDTLDAIASTSMTWQQQNRVGWRKYGKKLLAQGGKASPFKDQEAVAMYYKYSAVCAGVMVKFAICVMIFLIQYLTRVVTGADIQAAMLERW